MRRQYRRVWGFPVGRSFVGVTIWLVHGGIRLSTQRENDSLVDRVSLGPAGDNFPNSREKAGLWVIDITRTISYVILRKQSLCRKKNKK